MNPNNKTIEAFISEQVASWKTRGECHVPVITVCTEPGSGGHVIAENVAKQLRLSLYDRDIIRKVAESASASEEVIATMEKERLSAVEDFIAALMDDQYLYRGIYLNHLVKVVSAIASHGKAVIIGRGANFILPPEECLRVRFIAPMEKRIANVVRTFGVTEEEARQRISHREKARSSFIRQAFNHDARNPQHYDLVLNTAHLSVEGCVGSIVGAAAGKKAQR
jgi:cytidylate kinase